MSRLLIVFCWLCSATLLQADDWTHWRGPNQTGSVDAKGLPDEWDPRTVGKNNLIWKQPYGCRSTPMVMNGRVFIISAKGETLDVPTDAEKQLIGERVVAFDAAKGTVLWEKDFNVFHTDIVVNRLGWAPVAGDAKNDLVYTHSTAGFLHCFKGSTGEHVWTRQLTEELGRVSGYGGRIGGGPIFDSGLVIVGIVNGSWGNHAIGTNRFVAFDGLTGKIVWYGETPAQGVKGTYYSNPVVAVINGERLLITGAADGGVHAFQVRTGKRVWSYHFAAGVINPSPVVDGNFVWISHGEENPTGSDIGKIICLDASKVEDGKPKLVWEYTKGVRWGLASMAYADGKLYVPDDGAKLFCFDAKKGGKELWKYAYGTTSRGAPLVADGKLYISETIGKFHIIKLKPGKEAPDDAETHTTNFKVRPKAKGFVESNSTPSIGDGVIYLATRDEIYCIGTGQGTAPKGKPQAQETPGEQKVAQVALFPAEVTVKPGEKINFEVRLFNAKGQPILTRQAFPMEWSLPQPPAPKGATTAPPPLDAQLDPATGTIAINPKKAAQQGYVAVKVEGIEGRARVRVAPQIPYKQDFEMVPLGGVPAGWVNTQGKFRVVELNEDGKKNKVLFKVNNDSRPPISRANAYISQTDISDYTIEADIKGLEAKKKLPDMGVVNGRYLLILDGKTDENGHRELRLTSWEALPRINIQKEFTWKSGVWYHTKLSVESKSGVVKAKVWPKGEPEPAEWTIEFTDPMPNTGGAAALYGYISNAEADSPGGEIYYDNVMITPLKK
jgi:outer membrane protein assembly factor BamB